MPSINSLSCVSKAGWDTGSIWKNDETQTFIESVLRINRVFLRLSCRQLSSMQLWWSQKQADGEEFCFQMEEKPICRKKRQLVHLNRLQVASCQKAKSWGTGSGPGSVWLPTDQRNHRDNGALPPLIRLACRRPACLGKWKLRKREPTEAFPGQVPTLTPLEHQVPLFCCCSTATWWFVLSEKKNLRKDTRSSSHMANLLGWLWSFGVSHNLKDFSPFLRIRWLKISCWTLPLEVTIPKRTEDAVEWWT